MDRNEAERIAAAMHDLRPDWVPKSLTTMLLKHHAHRPFRDVALAAAYIATTPEVETPGALQQPGPWWGQPIPEPPKRAAVVGTRCPDHPTHLMPCPVCRVQTRPARTPGELRAGLNAARSTP